jgi:hypothetical protein
MAATRLHGAAEVPMRVCNVCLTHDPAYGGLHRSVQDFSRALSASVLSFDDGPFDDGRGERVNVEEGVSVRRLGCGTGWLARDCHVMPAAVARQADAIRFWIGSVIIIIRAAGATLPARRQGARTSALA